MAANNKAVQVRVEAATASKARGQRAHDLRIGPQPNYVDASRAHLNRNLIENATGAELRAICEERRSQRDTTRAMKSNAAICFSGIITFGHAAQTYFDELTIEAQDAAYREIAEAVATRLETSLHGLVHHGDETSPHAHFQLAGFTHDGKPVSQIAKRTAMRDLQTIAADVIAKYHPRIERGTSRRERLENGENYADTVHKSGAEMRQALSEDLPKIREQIAEAEQKRGEAEAKLVKNERLAEKARVKAAENGDKAASALKNFERYEKRAQDARDALESLSERQEVLEVAVARLEQHKAAAQNDLETVEKAVAQKKTKIASLKARLQTLNAA